ncbi:MAG: DUF523 domain-containing protein [Magnetococcus sp. DMHC-6]
MFGGQDKRQDLLLAVTPPWIEWYPLCPEAQSRLGVPREPMHLVGDPNSPKLITIYNHCDQTKPVLDWSKAQMQTLAQKKLAGFILKSRSPSCGLGGIGVYGEQGQLCSESGVGVFAQMLRKTFPKLPILEESELQKIHQINIFFDRLKEVKN